jgi:hypothetical protein
MYTLKRRNAKMDIPGEGFPDERAQPVLERESRESMGRGCKKPSGF